MGEATRTVPILEAPPPPQTTTASPAGSSSPIHGFTAMPSHVVSVLGPRRHPTAAAQMGNSRDAISICTSSGFQNLAVADYIAAVAALKPDIAIPLADLNYASLAPLSKRAVRMAERTESWIVQLFAALSPAALRRERIAVFAPTLPVPYAIQWEYLNRLADLAEGVAGLAVYDVDILPELADYPVLQPLPRLSLDHVASPHHILRHVSLGADILLLPFINAASDSGVGFVFEFPPPPPAASSGLLLPLGLDLASPENLASLAPLVEGCECYTCTRHHRAYLHHLLNAGEMLAWTLLQIHNHHVMNEFFSGIRASLAAEPPSFEEDCRRFALLYESELPAGQGERPRARGYHFKSAAYAEKINPAGWEKLDPMHAPGSGPETPNGAEGSLSDTMSLDTMSVDAMETPPVLDNGVEELGGTNVSDGDVGIGPS